MRIQDKIIHLEKLAELSNKLKSEGKTIALVSGCYNILHSGHAVFFNQCKEFADILVVSVATDSVISRLKGKNQPAIPEQDRLFIVAALLDVDYAVLSENEILPGKINFDKTIRALQPDFFILNEDDSAIKEKQELCNELGVELKFVKRVVPSPLVPISSTEIINKIQKSSSFTTH